jgi:hypothetical protein
MIRKLPYSTILFSLKPYLRGPQLRSVLTSYTSGLYSAVLQREARDRFREPVSVCSLSHCVKLSPKQNFHHRFSLCSVSALTAFSSRHLHLHVSLASHFNPKQLTQAVRHDHKSTLGFHSLSPSSSSALHSHYSVRGLSAPFVADEEHTSPAVAGSGNSNCRYFGVALPSPFLGARRRIPSRL